MENKNKLKPKEVTDEIRKQLDLLFNEAPHLFVADVHEITAVHQLACLLKTSDLFKNYSIDLEFNRITGAEDGEIIKKTFKENPEKIFRPDLIIHIPKTQLANLVVLEFSKENNNKDEEKKLKELTKRDGKYGYRMGILVDLPKYESWQFFVDGELFKNEREAFKRLKYLENESKMAFCGFCNFNIDFQVGNEDLEESRNQIFAAKNCNNNFLWDEASNLSETIYHENTMKIVNNCMNFPCNFKRYFQTVFIPDYFGCFEIVNVLYTQTLKEIEKNYPEIIMNDDWSLSPDLVFPYIISNCKYCHFNLCGDFKNKKEPLVSLNKFFRKDLPFDGSLNF